MTRSTYIIYKLVFGIEQMHPSEKAIPGQQQFLL